MSWGAHESASRDAREGRAAVLGWLNHIFMKLVAPRSFDDILARFHRDIVRHGNTIHDLWSRAPAMSVVV